MLKIVFASDVPLIISGDQAAFLDPQEQLWEGVPGQIFSLLELSGSDHLASVHGISQFKKTAVSYPKTLFRFPLRNAESGLSENIYTIQKVNELIEVLISEAKLLLLFLRSVHTIEVYNIDSRSLPTLSFQMKIADDFTRSLTKKRSLFLEDLKSSFASRGYDFSKVIPLAHRFDVMCSVYDAGRRKTTLSHWQVDNRVDSTNPAVREASVKQKVFPWVGTAVELPGASAVRGQDVQGKGRIFCFLPMPIGTASNLPVHVNGTFSVSDDRRNLKWPEAERKNDPMANWNAMLVQDVIPQCYYSLLLEVKQTLGKKFYNAWPDVKLLRGTPWETALKPVFEHLLGQNVILTESGVWADPSTAVYVPTRPGKTISQVVKTALTNCKTNLAEIPKIVWNAFGYIRMSVSEVTPAYLRDKLRDHPNSYASFSYEDKLELFRYCISDEKYDQLVGLHLLPLANGSFAVFQTCDIFYSDASSAIYLCTPQFPRRLLPILDHKLVDLSSCKDLQMKMKEIVKSGSTQLRMLDVPSVSTLLDEAMPVDADSLPNENFDIEWFELFWSWVRSKQLNLFRGKLVFPVHSDTSSIFNVVPLLPHQPVLYISSYTQGQSDTMFSVLNKFGIQYCTQKGFPYVEHTHLTDFIKSYNTSALLEAMDLIGHCTSTLFLKEAEYLRREFAEADLSERNHVLKDLKIFSSCANSSNSLYSINEVVQQSSLQKVVVQPSKTIDLSVLPSNMIIFSNHDYYQTKLLNHLRFPLSSDIDFLVFDVLPNVQSDKVMLEVLKVHRTLHYPAKLSKSIQSLAFVKVTSGARKRPDELFDPRVSSLSEIFRGESIFPAAPYDAPKFVSILEHCGLRKFVDPQEILNVIMFISSPASSSPQLANKSKMRRANAILQHFASSDFQSCSSATYQLDPMIHHGGVSFPEALLLLSTKRCWLPVLPDRPSSYPSCLPWKGEGYTSHFVSLKGPVCVYPSKSSPLPLAFGSHAYFTLPCGQLQAGKPIQSLLSHLSCVMAASKDIAPNKMEQIVHQIYTALLEALLEGAHSDILNKLKSVKEWVYIKKHNKFVSVHSVAETSNFSFSHHVEPFLYILPESFSQYSQLFRHFGMSESITTSQIVSMLGMIKEQIRVSASSVSPDKAWSTVMAILNWLTDNGTMRISSQPESVHVPAESTSKLPDLRKPSELVYSDNEYVRSYLSSLEAGSSYLFIHRRISKSLATCLNVKLLSEEIGISEDTFEDAGQYEPLIVRLENILREYKDGLTIVKELIQNADDAEATEVNICYDTRTHTTDRSKLVFPDMSEAHGPALVVHNDAVFSDEDFENIQKLAAATKQNKHLKIGKFGVGFCSVYHITDVPSFLSRERLYIFDPTLKHLGKAVKNKSQPGKMVKYGHQLVASSKQMEPYDRLFGFRHDKEYKGTIFRLPFRKSSSKLSTTCYSDKTVQDLIESIQQCGDKLLLFLQHVKRITVQRFDVGKSSPDVVFELQKTCIPQCLPLESTSVVAVSSTSGSSEVSRWLVTTYETDNEGKTAVANVACSLNGSCEPYSVNNNLRGEVFCYLPLSLSSGLHVHVSCNFAVAGNRRGIWIPESSTLEDDDSCPASPSPSDLTTYDEVRWNIFLMNYAIPVAYIRLLCSLKMMHEKGNLQDYDYYSIWPLSSSLHQKNLWEDLAISFYHLLLKDQLFYSEATSQWITLDESKFVDTDILCYRDTLPCVLDILHHLNLPLVDLPSSHRMHLQLSDQLIKEVDFIELFFDNIPQLNQVRPSRNEVVYHMLKTLTSEKETNLSTCQLIESKLENYACIPTTPDGSVLRKCTEMIDPRASFAKLFEESDNRFPIPRLTDDLALSALKHAGMMHTSLPWELTIDRAQSIQAVIKTNPLKALERVQLILSTMSTTLMVSGEPPCEPAIDSIPFLPVMKKPKDYPLNCEWFGDNYQLLPGNQLMLSGEKAQNVHVTGSQVAFICEDSPECGGCGQLYSSAIRKLLQLRSYPTVDEVILHLIKIIDCGNSESASFDWVSHSCQNIYDFLDDHCRQEEDVDLSRLQNVPCIWNDKMFLKVDSVATNWNKKFRDGPYLYSTPPNVDAKKAFVSALNIKEDFHLNDAIEALKSMKYDFGTEPISKVCSELINDMMTIFRDTCIPKEETGNCREVIYLPDLKGVLHDSTKLVYNDVSWALPDEDCILVNSMFSRELAVSLGVRPQKFNLLEQYIGSFGVSFGQHEDLTRRIQNIIRDYPFDITVLKELLQNADDAKAEKMYIILDKRTHGKESVISTEWEDLQGPALLVWNNKKFSEDDLKGIQKLGLGSKSSDLETIGQFGIGFNVVYHLTDCPSFITGGETLCVLDPHRRYVEEATLLQPGGRYNNLSQGFWKKFEDMGSAYLQSGLDGLPDELKNGSLFRFPVRHSTAMVESSKIVCDGDNDPPSPLTAESLSEKMKEWMPSMKQAMFFLNHVREIKYFEIDSGTRRLRKESHYTTSIDQSQDYDRSQEDLRVHVSNFTKDTGCKTCTILYPLVLSDIDCKSSKTKTETWLIQQGIGDVDDEAQFWRYIKTVKPRHAIAAPLEIPSSEPKGQSGKLFCFLPLPAKSDVPVHVNGSFVLNSMRRNLHVSSDPEVMDDKAKWNERLYKAIASSYARFLIDSRKYYLKNTYKKWHEALDALHDYYRLFPTFMVTDIKKKWDKLSCEVYRSLVRSNAEVLCVFASDGTKGALITVEWHSLVSDDPAQQVHFWDETKSRDIIHPILQSMGLKITSAPPKIMNCFNRVFIHLAKLLNETAGGEDTSCRQKIPSISPHSVFKYYTEYSELSSARNIEQCQITHTIFKNADTFVVFVKYLVGMELEQPPEISGSKIPSGRPGLAGLVYSYSNSILVSSAFPFSTRATVLVDQSSEVSLASPNKKFPESPFSHFLLLTADGHLRRFEENGKVLNSGYSHLFRSHLEKFLHQALQAIDFDPVYFVQSSEETLPLILSIFDNTFPSLMKNAEVSDAAVAFPREQLQRYWECFDRDEIFSCCLPKFLKHWALLLTDDNRLFSTSSTVLPAYHPKYSPKSESASDPTIPKMCDIMKSLEMPFLDITIVTASVTDCPQLTNRDLILKNFFHINEDKPLELLLDNVSIKDLIEYFSRDSKPSDCEWLRKIRSLPLFIDVASRFQPIINTKAYLWPKCSTAGYSEWIHGTEATFIQHCGTWTSLGSAEQLSIEYISNMEVYTYHILGPRFKHLSEFERYEHLQHIRIHIYPSAMSQSEKFSQEFIDALKAVKCIGPDIYNIKPISAFCDHTTNIFNVFSSDFQSLPEKLRSEDWLRFFKELGLKVKLEPQEFLNLCHKVAARKVDVESCSDVLLTYLFSLEVRKKWHSDSSFLWDVSNIAFVPSADTSRVNWLVPGACNANELVKLNGAASATLKRILWTVKPVIHLPQLCLTNVQNHELQTTRMLNFMNFTWKADVPDILSNIKNITQGSLYADKKLFQHYSIKPPKEALSLLDIMLTNILHLNRALNASSENFASNIQSLSCIPCIPVYCDLLDKEKEKMVLVEPSCVLVTTISSQYHPYLYSLPEEFTNYLSLLQKAEVCYTLELHHIQVVLQKVFTASQGTKLINPNTKECVKKAIVDLRSLLQALPTGSDVNSTAASLTPLYLPDTDDVLKLSTTMIYGDTPQYFGQMQIDLSGTRYSHFNVAKDQYGADAKHVCHVLPEEVRPLKMSMICKKLLARECSSTTPSDVSRKIQQSIALESNPLAILELFSKFLTEDIDEYGLKETLVEFFASMNTVTIQGLKTQLILRESNKKIGEQESSFFIETGVSELFLYIDHKFDDEDEVFDDVVEQLHSTVSGSFPNGLPWEENTDLFKAVKKYLKADTAAKKESLLARHEIRNVEVKTGHEFELGEEIPKSYNPWLDQNAYNIFKPREYVGYEDRDGHIIYAQVVHLVPTAEGDDHLHRVYYVLFSSEPGIEGKEVSIYHLYKFITDTSGEDSALILEHEIEMNELKKSLYEGEIADIKESLQKELRAIWKLCPELRNKAIKRLYLKWHPHKNLGDPVRAEEIFTYLKEQVEILENDGLDDSPSRKDYPSSMYISWNTEASDSSIARGAYSPFSCVNVRRRNPEEGKRWVKQAEVEFATLCGVHATLDVPKRYGHVCFLAHQVAEKALKGGVYALCGMDGHGLFDHELARHAYALVDARPDMKMELVQHANHLDGRKYFLNTRYPNRWSSGAPADHYDERDAEEAKKHAECVLSTVKLMMP